MLASEITIYPGAEDIEMWSSDRRKKDAGAESILNKSSVKLSQRLMAGKKQIYILECGDEDSRMWNQAGDR